MMFGLMRERVNVRDFKKELLSDNFGLAFLPKQLWQERLGVLSLDANALFTPPRENEEPLACK